MNRFLAQSSLALSAAAIMAACAPIQTVGFAVREPDGRTTHVDKYYSSVLTDDPGDQSFKQVQAGHIDEAMATLKAAVASQPKDPGWHYDLALLHEAKGDWRSAVAEILVARELAPTAQMYIDEEAFITRHVGK